MALTDLKVRTVKPTEKQQKLYDGGGLPDAKRQGAGSSSIRASIKAALDLLSEA
uniref:hypothetical protein n=1 Tax=Burkholderia diffusa TaxID=488732 RepID=UPI001CC68CCC|nr:hypothetical protein [Burkholderia diffusa]